MSNCAPISVVFLCILLGGMCQHALAQVPVGKPVPRVLLLYSNDRLLPAGLRLDEGFRGALGPMWGGRYELFTEFLDAVRFPEEARQDAMAEALRIRYQKNPPQVLVASGPEALRFFQNRRDSLFPGTPLVFGGIRLRDKPSDWIGPEVVGVPLSLEIAPTLDLALRLRPQTREVVVVSGSAKLDREWDALARTDFQPFESRVKVTFWNELPFAELTRRVGTLSPETVVFYLTYFQEPDGTPLLSSAHALELLAATSPVPIFGSYDTYIGKGIVGGMMTDFVDEGAAVARLVQRVLAGDTPQAIGVQPPRPGVFQFDSRQLDRWKITTRALPPGSVVAFQTPTLWQEHPRTIIATIAVILMKSALLAGLLIHRSRRFRSEAELGRSEQRMSLAADSTALCLWEWDMASDELWATDQARVLLDIEPGRRIDYLTLLGRVHPEDRASREETIRQTVAAQSSYEMEYRVLLPDGTLRWVGARGRCINDGANGSTTRLVGVSMDITKQKTAEEEARQHLNEMTHLTRVSTLGGLATTLAHELNQPLSAIHSNAEAAEIYLQKDAPDLPELRAILSDIRADGHRAGEVIHRMRSMLQPHQFKTEQVNVGSLVKALANLLNGTIRSSQAQMHLEMETTFPPVQGDAVLLQQLLLNLILNALDAMADIPASEREVVVRAAVLKPGWVEVSVTDRGPGFPPEKLAKLSEPFFTTKKEGMGMGLAICHSIAKSHGGRLSAENLQGRGAAVRFSLPVSAKIE